MKSTADVLVMVYLNTHKDDKLKMLECETATQHVWTLGEFNLQTNSDEEQAPVGQSNIQSCGQG